MFSQEEIAGPNVEFSRHAAREPMVARYRRMPHGRLQFVVGTSLPPLTFCNLPKLPGCGIRTAQTNLLRAPRNYFDAEFRPLMGCVRHQTAANLLPRAPRFVRYETRLLPEEIAGPNVEFSRRAARKPMVARYRQMPHGRLEFDVRPKVRPESPNWLVATDTSINASCSRALRSPCCTGFGSCQQPKKARFQAIFHLGLRN